MLRDPCASRGLEKSRTSGLMDIPSYLNRKSFDAACSFLRNDVIGSDGVVRTSYGRRQLLYTDYATSGRLLKSIEEFIQREVLAYCGNTRTLLSNAMGSIDTLLRIEARQLIQQCLTANQQLHHHALILCDSGTSTASIDKFIEIMHKRLWNIKLANGPMAVPLRPSPIFANPLDSSSNTAPPISERHSHTSQLQFSHAIPESEESAKLQDQKHNKDSPLKATGSSARYGIPNTRSSLTLQRLVVLICDPMSFSSCLPFRELVKTSLITAAEPDADAGEASTMKTSSNPPPPPPPPPISSSAPSASSRLHLGKLPSCVCRRTNHITNLKFEFVELRLDPLTDRFDVDHLEDALIHCQQVRETIQQLFEKRSTDETVDIIGDDESKKVSASHFNADHCEVEVVPVCILTACSPITGLQVDVEKISELVHSYGGICCWDFASGVPSEQMRLNCSSSQDHLMDLIDVGFYSPHRLLGGAGASGVLLIKKALLYSHLPDVPLQSMSQDGQTDGNDGTGGCEEGQLLPDLVSTVRASLAYRLHTQLSPHHIAMREFGFVEYLLRHWSRHPRIQLLGTRKVEPLPESPAEYLFARMGVISLMIRYGNVDDTLLTTERDKIEGSQKEPQASGLYLHHQFVVALLNDLFGIQVRGIGVLWSQSLASGLLGMREDQFKDFGDCLRRTGQEVFQPGFIRASLHYSMSWDDVELLCQAVVWIADHGWRLLPSYTFVPKTGEWEHRHGKADLSNRRSIRIFTLVQKPGSDEIVVEVLLGGEPEGGQSEKEGGENVVPKKDPRKVAGAVSTLPLGSGGDPEQLKVNIQAALSGLKKPKLRASQLPAPPQKSPISELEAAMLKRLGKTCQSDNVADLSTTPTKCVSGDSSPQTELARKLESRDRTDERSVPRRSPSHNKSKDNTPIISKGDKADKPVHDTQRMSSDAVPELLVSRNCLSEVSKSVGEKRTAARPLVASRSVEEPESIKNDLQKSYSLSEPATASRAHTMLDALRSSHAKETEPSDSASQGDSPSYGRGVTSPTLPVTSNAHPASPGVDVYPSFFPDSVPTTLEEIMLSNHQLLETSLHSGRHGQAVTSLPATATFIPPLPLEYIHLLWFALPCDAVASLMDLNPKPRLDTEAVLTLVSQSGQRTAERVERPHTPSFGQPALSELVTVDPFSLPSMAPRQAREKFKAFYSDSVLAHRTLGIYESLHGGWAQQDACFQRPGPDTISSVMTEIIEPRPTQFQSNKEFRGKGLAAGASTGLVLEASQRPSSVLCDDELKHSPNYSMSMTSAESDDDAGIRMKQGEDNNESFRFISKRVLDENIDKAINLLSNQLMSGDELLCSSAIDAVDNLLFP